MFPLRCFADSVLALSGAGGLELRHGETIIRVRANLPFRLRRRAAGWPGKGRVHTVTLAFKASADVSITLTVKRA